MSLRSAMMFTIGAGGGVTPEPVGLNLSGLSATGNTVAWLDMSDMTGAVVTGSELVSLPNKGTLNLDWIASNSFSTGLPEALVNEFTGHNYLFFHPHGAKLQLGAPADWKFLHDGTQYLVAAVVAKSGNGSLVYSTVPNDISGVGTSLFIGDWGGGYQRSLVKIWKVPGFNWTGTATADEAMPQNVFRLITEQMRGYDVASGNKWEAFVNNNATPYAGNSNNSLDTTLSGVTGTNPYQALTVGHVADSDAPTYGIQMMQLIIRKYPAGTAASVIEADRAYIKNQTNAFYSIY